MSLALTLLAAAATASLQDTVRFTPTVGQPTFAVREPVLRIRPNTTLISNTMFGPTTRKEAAPFRAK